MFRLAVSNCITYATTCAIRYLFQFIARNQATVILPPLLLKQSFNMFIFIF